MKKLIQVIYISHSTFQPTTATNKIEPNVARILAKSRVNNRKNGLVGVLYFGDGVFFQCIEGEDEAVNRLLTKLSQDTRHKDLKILSKKNIEQLSFIDWAMKFAPLDEKISAFLKENGFQTFDPYLFTNELVETFLAKLFSAYDPTIDIKASNSISIPTDSVVEQYEFVKTVQLKSNIALIFSVVAVILSLIQLLR